MSCVCPVNSRSLFTRCPELISWTRKCLLPVSVYKNNKEQYHCIRQTEGSLSFPFKNIYHLSFQNYLSSKNAIVFILNKKYLARNFYSDTNKYLNRTVFVFFQFFSLIKNINLCKCIFVFKIAKVLNYRFWFLLLTPEVYSIYKY